jgi:hypothetical protein
MGIIGEQSSNWVRAYESRGAEGGVRYRRSGMAIWVGFGKKCVGVRKPRRRWARNKGNGHSSPQVGLKRSTYRHWNVEMLVDTTEDSKSMWK